MPGLAHFLKMHETNENRAKEAGEGPFNKKIVIVQTRRDQNGPPKRHGDHTWNKIHFFAVWAHIMKAVHKTD